ncbi:MAG: TonB-dependent receptor plug domain-containing protein, partial [Bacteroidales bacterium]|nr:TonB-dependent receptor plug domain-containing protein [Bacteroidales bacterium]
MRKFAWMIILFNMWLVLQAQQEEGMTLDTIRLDAFTIFESVPLNDNSVLDLSRSSRFSSIDKINQRLDGISLIRRGAYAMEPQMDGFSGGQINITVDGMKMFGACTDRMDPVTSYIETDNLESFRITHGTGGSHNGNTVGGSFDMILKEPATGEKDLSVYAGMGFESVSKGIDANGAIELNRESWAFRSSGTYRKHSSYRGGDGGVVPFTQFEKINLHSVLRVDINTNNILRFLFLLDDAINIGYPALPMDVGEARARMYAIEYRMPGYDRIINQVKAKIYYNSVYHLMDDSKRDSLFTIEGDSPGDLDTVVMHMDMPGWSDTYGFYLEGNINPGKKNQLYFRIDDYLNFSAASMTMHMENPDHPDEPPMYAETWPDMFRNVAGIFGRNTTYLNQSVKINVEARIDMSTTRVISETGHRQFEIFGYNIDREYLKYPKSLNFNLSLNSHTFYRLNAGVGYSERLPTSSEQFGFFLFNALDGYDYLGNPDIDLERSAHTWANIHFTWQGFKLSLRNRFSRVNDYIMGQIDREIPQMNIYASGLKRYMNIPFALVYGGSLQLQWKPVEMLTLYSLSRYTYARTGNGDPLPMIPPLRNVTICKFKYQRASLQAEGEFSTAQNRINSSFGETATPAFAIYNIRASFHRKVAKAMMEISTGVENLLNKAYSEHMDWGNFYRPGRSVFIRLGINI